MLELIPVAERIAAILKQRRQKIVVSESSSGGLVSAALLAVPGASAYFLGGVVIYTGAARDEFLRLPPDLLTGMRPASEPHEIAIARHVRERFGADYCLVEHGAAGPTGNRYGDAAGHCSIAVAGTRERAMTLETGSTDRAQNMIAFARAALEFLLEELQAAG